MKHANSFALHTGWRVILKDLGIRPSDVLQRAGLPDDLLTQESVLLPQAQYFDFWRGLEEVAADPTLPIRICRSISAEAFHTPIFAAVCSPNLNTAVRRISHFKKLLGPMALHVDMTDAATTLELEWLDKTHAPPICLVATELVFFVQLARLMTREEIHPLAVTTPNPPQPEDAYSEYFGCEVEKSLGHRVIFSAKDAARPFLTANSKMWEFFEPELRKRLSELDETATVSDQVRGALFELLPSGRATLQAVSRKLGLSTRTLQRKLSAEGRSFRQVLDTTREELARHYLRSSAMSGAEISFLLGYKDPNSFFRAFYGWTGETPEQVRSAMLEID